MMLFFQFFFSWYLALLLFERGCHASFIDYTPSLFVIGSLVLSRWLFKLVLKEGVGHSFCIIAFFAFAFRNFVFPINYLPIYLYRGYACISREREFVGRHGDKTARSSISISICVLYFYFAA